MAGGMGSAKIDRWPQKCVRAAQRSMAPGKGLWGPKWGSQNKISAATVSKAPAPVKFPSESAKKAIKEFQNIIISFSVSLRKAAALYGSYRSKRFEVVTYFKITSHCDKIYKINYYDWLTHENFTLIQALSVTADCFSIFGYRNDRLEHWRTCLEEWGDFFVNIKAFAHKEEFEKFKNNPLPDVSQYTRENPMPRSMLAKYFLLLAFGGGSRAAKARYAKFCNIVAEMEAVEPQFKRAAQIIIDDSKRSQEK